MTQSLSIYKSTAIFDAEIIVPDDAGRPDFDALQARWLLTNEGLIRKREAESPAQLYVFDLLHQGDHDLIGCKLTDRKQMLTHILIEYEKLEKF